MFGFPSQKRDSALKLTPRIEQLEDRTVPALFAVPDFYTVPIGQVLTVPFTEGVLANDFSDDPQFQNLRLTATLNQGAKYVGDPRPLPQPNLFLNPDGGFTFIAPSAGVIPPGVTQVQFKYNLDNGAEPTAVGTVTINLVQPGRNFIATGADAGGGPHVRVYEAGTSLLAYNFFPYEPTFTGGVRVAVGDVDGDGIDDIATIPAFGGGPRLRIFSGRDGAPMVDTFVFDPNFRGGGYVAIGDFSGDGIADIIVGAGEGGGSRVQVFTLVNPALGKADPGGNVFIMADFFAYNPEDRNGVRVAAGDLDGNGIDEIVTALGPGGNGNVRVFVGQNVIGRPVANPSLSFFVPGTGPEGVFVATGNLRGDGKHDIITGTGASTVRVFDGRNAGLIREFRVPADETPTGGGGFATGPAGTGFSGAQSGILLSPATSPGALVPTAVGSFGLVDPLFANIRGGVRVAATDWDGDGLDDIVVALGPGNTPRVRVFNAATQTEIASILAYSPTFLGGVNVAGTTG